MHLLSHSVPTAFRLDERLVEKIREIIGVAVGAQNYVATATAIAAVGSALRNEFLAPKTDRPASAAAGLG